jgi:hypothetical protein
MQKIGYTITTLAALLLTTQIQANEPHATAHKTAHTSHWG